MKKKKYFLFSFLLITFLTFSSSNSFSWGGRGHAVICESAIHLVKNKELKVFLLHKTHIISYLCNIPDTYWRSLPNSESGNSTHFIEPDLVGSTIEDSPTQYTEFVNKNITKINRLKKNQIYSVAKEIGTSWWRAEQFVNLAIAHGKKAKTLDLPSVTEEKSDEHPYNKEIQNMIINMGLLGHFVGDNSQPLHNSSNYDGWENGHGGIHGYFEENIVVILSPKLLSEIINKSIKAAKELDFVENSSVLEKMKRLSILTSKDLNTIWKLDPIIEPSELKLEKGMEIRKPARRKNPEQNASSFESLITQEMSRSAVLLAQLWDQIYQTAGTPNLEVAKYYKFPHTPEFIAPNYTEK